MRILTRRFKRAADANKTKEIKVPIYNDITETTGNTPLVRINRLNDTDAVILAKIESFNPLSSVKDRIGVAMINDAEKKGKLKKGDTVIEPTSGNTGIALAFACAARGYNLVLTMPDTMSTERRQLLEILGARIVLTDGRLGMKGAIETALKLQSETPGSFMPQQFRNQANPEIHMSTTGPEIWGDCEEKVDYFVAGVGTGGTITGTGAYLKKMNPDIKIIAVEPEDSAVLSGRESGPHRIQGLGAGFIPEVLKMEIIDEVIPVTDADAAETARRLPVLEGILTGISGGAAMNAALTVAARPESAGKVIVVVLPDSGERYLSTWLFSD